MKHVLAACAGLILLGTAASIRAQAAEAGPGQSATRESDAREMFDAGGFSAEQIEEALTHYAHEPSVDAVLQAALQAGSAIDVEAVAARARSAGWIPRVSLRARRGQTLDLTNPLDDESLRVKSNNDLTLEAALTFDLDRLVFHSDEVALLRQRRNELDARRELVRQVIHLYYERRRLQVERDLEPDGKVARSVRIAEIGALLNAFTGGAFQRMIEQARWRTGERTREPRSPSRPRSSPTATR